MDQFRRIQSHILHDKNYTHFTRVIGEHALCMYELATAAEGKCAKVWGHLNDVNNEWIALISKSDDKEFAQWTRNMVLLYSETMGDFVFNRTVPKNMKEIIQKESAFYKALSQTGRMEMATEWTHYTRSIIYMIRMLDQYGKDSPYFYYGVNACLEAGILLGQWLNHALFKRPWTPLTGK